MMRTSFTWGLVVVLSLLSAVLVCSADTGSDQVEAVAELDLLPADTEEATIASSEEPIEYDPPIWPAAGYDGSGLAPYVGPTKLKLKWEFVTDGDIMCSPVIGCDTTIYVLSEAGTLYALTKYGTLDWSIDAWGSGCHFSKPIVMSQNGTIFMFDSGLAGVDANGDIVVSNGRDVRISDIGLSITPYGDFLYVSDYKGVWAVDYNGAVRWYRDIPYTYDMYNSICDDNVLLSIIGDRRIMQLDSDGEIVFDFSLPLEEPRFIGWLPGEYFYFMVYGNHDQAYRIDLMGNIIDMPDSISCYPGDLQNTRDGNLLSVNWRHMAVHKPDGELVWLRENRPVPRFQEIIFDSVGHMYLTDREEIIILDHDGTELDRYRIRGRITAAPALSSDGTLYIVSDDNAIYAFTHDRRYPQERSE